MDKVVFTGEFGESMELYVLETTRLQGIDYYLASDVEQGDGNCYILKELPSRDGGDPLYEIVSDEGLLDYLASIFGEQMDDADILF
jgi:hypothetical protein